MSVIEAEDVGFAFGDTVVLDGISLAIDRGITCILGANGAGKTTFLRLVAGLLAPNRGQVRCLGADPRTIARRQLARRLAYLPQSYRLAFPFTVTEVVLMGRYAHRGPGLLGLESDADVDEARAAMRRCDIDHLGDRRFDAISGGERRRALLAQAFCQRAELVLLDEPTASLDPSHAIAVFEALVAERDHRGSAAVVVTHDLNLAVRFADRAVLLDGAAVTADGSPAEVLASDAATRAFGVPLHVGALPAGGAFAVPT